MRFLVGLGQSQQAGTATGVVHCSYFRSDYCRLHAQRKHRWSDRPCLRAAGFGPNGECADVRVYGGYLGGFLTWPVGVVKATARCQFLLCSVIFRSAILPSWQSGSVEALNASPRAQCANRLLWSFACSASRANALNAIHNGVGVAVDHHDGLDRAERRDCVPGRTRHPICGHSPNEIGDRCGSADHVRCEEYRVCPAASR